MMSKKALVAGWFSYLDCQATAGDIIARDVVCGWLDSAGWSYDIASALPNDDGIDWKVARPTDYDHVIFVCGPFSLDNNSLSFLKRFKGCHLIGVNLSMIEPLTDWNPFDVLISRDSDSNARPDLSFLGPQRPVPVVGVLLVHPQQEYGNKAHHSYVNSIINEFISNTPMVALQIDTKSQCNKTGLRDEREIESLISRMDLVLTTRLHGTVLAIKNGVPAIAIDPIEGGGKGIEAGSLHKVADYFDT